MTKVDFEKASAKLNVSSTAKKILKVLCVAVAAVLGFVIGAVVGAAAGGALGSVAGPGAVIPAAAAALVVGAKFSVIAAPIGAGVVTTLTACGLFRDSKATRLCQQVAKEVEASRTAAASR